MLLCQSLQEGMSIVDIWHKEACVALLQDGKQDWENFRLYDEFSAAQEVLVIV